MARFILAFLFVFAVFANANVARPSTHGKLHVVGSNLYDHKGNLAVLKGFSTHGLTWFPKYVNQGLFRQISSEWNTNLIRLAMYSYDYCNGNKKKNLEILEKGVEFAIANDMYVIIDWHILQDNNPNENLAEAIDFFNKIAKKYANIPNVIFEICNEPNGNTTWDDIKEYSNLIIPVIRRYNPDALILVGTPNYSREIQFPAKDPLEFKNVMYVFHFYAASHKDDFRQKLRKVVASGTPIFITESGLCEEDGDGHIDLESVKKWYSLVDSLHLNYTIWSLSNKDETCAIVNSDSRALEYLTEKDLTYYGKLARAIIRKEDVDSIILDKSITSDFKLMSRTKPYMLWLIFAAPALIIVLLLTVTKIVLKNLKRNQIKTYTQLYKYGHTEDKVRKPSFWRNAVLIIGTICTLIYLCWRMTCSIPFAFGNIAVIGSVILLAVEILGFIESLIHYNDMLNLRKYPLPQIKPEEFPDVDIFISTYNEPVELLRKTIIGCKYIEYPDKNKVHIYLCDDHRRPEMRKLAEKLGVNYFDRPDNKGAKAGNLNEALKRTTSPYIVTLDADMIPRRKFLLKTIPYFIDAEKINETLPEEKRFPLGIVQTPQSFYTPDVFQHNLYAETIVPNEQDFFYRVIEAAKTSSNSVIYGGSNTILSRKALNKIGGFYTESITEDFATGMLIESSGFASLGLSEALASGIAPNSFKEHIQQRTRWGRGVIATAKQLKFLRNRKLNFAQKLSYLSSVLYWFSPIKHLVYLLSPLMFAVFCIPIFKCTLLDLILFWLPMHIMQIISLRVLSRNMISTRWSGIYETSVMPFLLIPIIKEALGLTLSTFKVTKKEKANERIIDKKSLIPFIVLLTLTVLGIAQMTYMFIVYEYIGVLAILFWLFINSYYLIMCIMLVLGRDADGENVKVRAAELVEVTKEDGCRVSGITTKLLEHGVDIYTDNMNDLYLGEPINFEIQTTSYTLQLKGTVVAEHRSNNPHIPSVYTVEILDFNGKKDEYIQMLYDRISTLPQYLKIGRGALFDIWRNISHRISS